MVSFIISVSVAFLSFDMPYIKNTKDHSLQQEYLLETLKMPWMPV